LVEVQASEEKNLVDFSLYQPQTKFQGEGIKGAKLSEEERNVLIAQGTDPDDIEIHLLSKRRWWILQKLGQIYFGIILLKIH
jgi:hypothetical protein